MKQWSTVKNLMWLFAKLKGGASAIIETITGNLPLVLQNAIQHSIKSLTRYGLCTQDGTPTTSSPVDIKCNNGELKWDSENQRIYADGTPEVLTVGGPNLLNPATNITGYYIGSTGSIAAGSDAQYTDLIPVNEGETYVCSLVSGRDSGSNRWHGYDANGTWVKQLAYVSATGQQGAKLAMVATIDSGISYVRLSYGITDTEAMIQWAPLSGEIIADGVYSGKMVSGTALAYRNAPIESPYTPEFGGNRGPAMIFSISPGKTYAAKDDIVTNYNSIVYSCYANIEDVGGGGHSPISKGFGNLFTAPNGANYAVVLYNNSNSGTTFTFGEPSAIEYQSQADYSPYVPPQTASVPMLLSVGDVKDEVELIAGTYTHRCAACLYDGTQDVGDTYLSTTGGKDIGAIIVYPLATPTTEHITGQTLVTNEGTNTVDATAEVGPLSAEVKYVVASAQDVLSKLLGMKVTKKDISTQDAEEMINIITGEENK